MAKASVNKIAEFLRRRRPTTTEIPQDMAGPGPSPDEAVSREHAVILWEEGVFTVEDLQSTNGIRLNGKRVRSAELHHGDEIDIGQTRILVIFR